jgi:hypothetical protein
MALHHPISLAIFIIHASGKNLLFLTTLINTTIPQLG